MIRRLLFAAALVAAAGRLAMAAACGPVPAASGPLLNGFEGGASACAAPESGDINAWAVTSNPIAAAATISASNGAAGAIEGTDYGWVTSTDIINAFLTITAGTSPELAANPNWTSDNYAMVAYYTLTTTATTFQFNFFNGNSTTPEPFKLAAKLIDTGTWTYVVTSLNYLVNESLSDNSNQWLQLELSGPNTGGPMGVALDDLQVAPTSEGLDTPNAPLTPAMITESPDGCAAIDLSWTALTTTFGGGTDTINGYQIYRSTTLASGPYSSIGYVLNAAAVGGVVTFTDNVPGASATNYYVVLPYASTSTVFGTGGTSYFTGCGYTAVDSHWVAADGGVNEALLSTALTDNDEVGPYNPNVGCSPTDTPSITQTYTDTFTATPTATQTDTYTATPTASPTSTSTATPTATSTATPTATLSFTASDTPSGTPSDTATPTATPTSTATPTQTLSFTDTATTSQTATPTSTPTYSDTETVTGTFTATATATPSATATATATSTATYTASLTATLSFTASATSTVTPSVSPSATETVTDTPSPSPSASPTFTISPTWTPTPPITGQYWPNPFFPDRNTHKFYLGAQPAGETWQVFNMIGQLVWQSTTVGNPDLDFWNGTNGNGAEVTTGVYLLYINGHIYRFAVVRN